MRDRLTRRQAVQALGVTGAASASLLIPCSVNKFLSWLSSGLNPNDESVNPTPTAVSSPTASPTPSQERKIYLGFTTEPADTSSINTLEESIGREYPIQHVYFSFKYGVDSSLLKELDSLDKTPLVTWEPWDPSAEVEDKAKQPEYQLQRIVDGDFDDLIRESAVQFKDFGKPIFLRFAHEMNGNWYPWSGTVNGNSPELYKAAWKHVWEVFKENEVKNVTWVWCPNGDDVGDSKMEDCYPGDKYVDWMGFDKYNWGTTQPWSRWQSLEDMIRDPYERLRAISDKPIMIAETASAEEGGDKAEWIKGALEVLASEFPYIYAIILFNIKKETDWRVESSEEALQAFRKAIADAVYSADSVEVERGKIVPITVS